MLPDFSEDSVKSDCFFGSSKIIFLVFNIFLNIEAGVVEKFQICSRILHLSSILYSLESRTFKTDKSLSRVKIHVFSRYFHKISFHLSLYKSLFSFFRNDLILVFAFAVFTKDSQNGFGFLFSSVIISITSQLCKSLSRVFTSQLF